MKRKKRKLNLKHLLILLIIILVISFVIYFVKKTNIIKAPSLIKEEEKYLGSTTNTVELYTFITDENKIETISKIDETKRGTEVKLKNKTKEYEEKEYTLIKLEDKEYYVLSTQIVDNQKDIVLEQEKYIRTSVTVYQNETDSKIASFIKKGNKIEILDYDFIDELGNVNMYKIQKDDITGWVYQKYLVDTYEEAVENYNENGVYDTHKDRKYTRELYGGSAKTLDYYPYEKVEFEDNPLLKNAKAMYLNAGSNVINKIDEYLDIAKNSGVNAIVVDIKDGALAYPSNVAKEYSITAYNSAINSLETYQTAINKIKASGIYVIGRIVAFNDPHYGKDHEEECIKTTVSSRLWPSAYSRGAWEYNVELAKEAVELMGFNEIQFDYVRFPEDSSRMSQSSSTDFRNTYNEEKAEAIQNFLFYALDQLHKEKVYVSVDVFGECSGTYVTAYGQYWPAISNVVDVISSMPYTDHFTSYGDNTKSEYWINAYKTVNNWAQTASKRQEEIPTPAIARTWITAYDTPYWNPTVTYDATKIADQAQALVDAGLTGGFITWNSSSSLSKYSLIKEAFSKNYN